MILLDDVFSALDRRTRLQIAKNLLQPDSDKTDSSPAIVYSTNDRKHSDRRVCYRLMHVSAQIASYADYVFEITPSGRLERVDKQSLQVDMSQPLGHEEHHDIEENSEGEQVQVGEVTPTAARPPQDRVVYMAYLRSMGWINAIAFLVLGASFAVALKFPGNYVMINKLWKSM